MRIGIDVGGTHTDAVLMEHATVLASYKTPTTPSITGGISTALRAMLQQTRVNTSEIHAVMIGTTQCLNALIERRNLMPVGVVRLGLPSTSSFPPMTGWPSDLREAIGNHVYMAHGGYEFRGRPISALDPNELRGIARDMRNKGIRSVAISAVFSPINTDIELKAAEIIRDELPEARITLSHEIGRIGLIERENAAIINACLLDLAHDMMRSFQQALSELSIQAPIYISQNDGTLMNDEAAERYPVLTFACGPTNSMRGGAFLSGLTDAIVMDIGGTTSDAGLLLRGFPHETSAPTEIGGVRNNLRMPNVYSIPLGGGSIVEYDGNEVRIGPRSVGYELTKRALVFGGDTLTATDIAVAAGLADLGNRNAVAHLPANLVKRAVDTIQMQIAYAVDSMRMSPEPVPAIIVGGGSILIQDRLPGITEIIIPDQYAVANAIGAAIAQMGGETDRIFSFSQIPREEALKEARQEAISRAINAGADPSTIRVTEVEEIPLSYVPGNTTRIRVKAVGDLGRVW